MEQSEFADLQVIELDSIMLQREGGDFVGCCCCCCCGGGETTQ